MSGRRRAGLTVGQVALLTLGFLASSIVIFVLGLWVGKSMTEGRLVRDEKLVRYPILRATPMEAPRRDPDIRLYETLVAPSPSPSSLPPTATAVPSTPAAFAHESPTPLPAPMRPQVAPPKRPARSMEEWADAGWTVQVRATANTEEAERMAAALREKGYRAYTVRVPKRDGVWYRVRVGHFRAKQEAERLQQELRVREGLADAFVTPR